MALTDKQKRFCEEYVIDWNATRAAKSAGYSGDTAQQMGSENLSKPVISDYIEEIQKDLSKLAGVSALRNVLELKKLAYSNLSDFKDGWLTVKDFEDLDNDTKAALSEVQYTIRGSGESKEEVVKFKLHDKQRAIEAINKMLGYEAPEKSEIKIESSGFTEEDNNRLKELEDKIAKELLDKAKKNKK